MTREGKVSVSVRELATYILGDMVVRYVTDETGTVALQLLPRGHEPIPSRAGVHWRQGSPLASIPSVVATLSSLVQAHSPTAALPPFSSGRSMLMSSLVDGAQLDAHEVFTEGSMTTITTRLSTAAALFEHRIEHQNGATFLTCSTRVLNRGSKGLILEQLSSACIDGITPFTADDAPDRLRVHRLRSGWGTEAYPAADSVAHLNLEPGWLGQTVSSERFGHIGSMPALGFHPAVVVEDEGERVSWGLSVESATSWQAELYRRDDNLTLSIGLPDFEFGHWRVELAPGDEIISPTARATVVAGTPQLAQRRMISSPSQGEGGIPDATPVIYNEYCVTWGNPTAATIDRLLTALDGMPIGAFVIDSGWYAAPGTSWEARLGDWAPVAERFPEGLAAVAASIRSRGLIAGLWFEPETVAGGIVDTLQLPVLKRDGSPITVGGRQFLDLRVPDVRAHLDKQVLSRAAELGFGYLKFDYNASVGVGCDGAFSLGASLREHGVESYRWLNKTLTHPANFVVETCASGGFRNEPGYVTASQLVSSSDAHETSDAPVVAANTLSIAPASKSLVWAVIKADLSLQEQFFRLAAGFLGRMCLSGDVSELPSESELLLRTTLADYVAAWPVIRGGTSAVITRPHGSIRHPRGIQAVSFELCSRRVLVIHAFEDAPLRAEVPIGHGWSISKSVSTPSASTILSGPSVLWDNPQEWSACVVFLERVT